MVVATHTVGKEVAIFTAPPVAEAAWLQSGVDVFFVISGFIMVHVIRAETTPGRFWIDRFTRIAPLYWLATAVAFAGGWLAPKWFFGAVSPGFALQSALFLPMGADANVRPLLSPGWTLTYEFAFYSLLAACLVVRRPPFALAAIAIGTGLVLGMLLFRQAPWATYYADDLLMLEFLLGMAAAWLISRASVGPRLSLLLAAMAFASLYFAWNPPGSWPRGLRLGIPGLVILVGVLGSEPLWQRSLWLRRLAGLGDASYAIYIVHFFFVTAITTFCRENPAFPQAIGPWPFMLGTFVIGIGSGLVAHRYVEKPLLKLVRSWLQQRRPAQPAIAAAAKV